MCLKIKETPFLQGVPLVTIVIYFVIPYDMLKDAASQIVPAIFTALVMASDFASLSHHDMGLKS